MHRPRLALTVLALLASTVGAALLSSCGARSELYVGPLEDAPPDVPEDGLPSCDTELPYIYLVTSETDLYRYQPDAGILNLVGNLACSGSASPFSMGVARSGTAYVLYGDGELYRVSTADASCRPTGWIPGSGGFNVFGTGFAIDDDMQGETLHVAEVNFQSPSAGLATIDTDTFELNFIGPFSENPGNAIELTSGDDGRLYGFFLNPGDSGGVVVEIDKATAEILSSVPLPTGHQGSGLAFAYWAGDFYIFTSAGVETLVTRYKPSDGSVEVVTTLSRHVVGAGVSTCTIP